MRARELVLAAVVALGVNYAQAQTNDQATGDQGVTNQTTEQTTETQTQSEEQINQPANTGATAGATAGATNEPMMGPAPSVTAQAPEEKTTGPALGAERVGIKPEFGYLAYQDPVAGSATRGTAGLALDFNVLPPATGNSPYVGIQTGTLYSQLGQAGSDFYGRNGSAGYGTGGSYMLTIPTDLKAGYNVMDSVRVSLHGGGNVLYRSNNRAINFGNGTNDGSSDFSYFPNAGAEAEVALGRHVDLTIRPDWTFTNASAFFIGSLGVDFALD